MAHRAKLRPAAANEKRTTSQNGVYCCLEIENSLLFRWHLYLQKHKSIVGEINRDGISSSDMPGYGAMTPHLQESPVVVAGSLEDRLRSKGRQLYSNLTRLSKRRKERLLLKTFIIDVNIKDIVPISAFMKEITELRNELEQKNQVLNETITKLRNYSTEVNVNTGKPIDEVGKRQRRRKVTALKEASKKALWFLDSFNLDITKIILTNKTSHEELTLSFSEESTCSDDSIYDNTMTKADEILFLLDSFGVSDEFYHELAMYNPCLPRSYLIKERRRLISSNVEIHRLPHPYFGCYRHLDDLMKEVISNFDTVDSPLTIKLSGDGAPFHRSSTYVLLSFSFPLIDTTCLSAAGNHTFAAISGHEEYFHLKNGLAPILDEINALIANPILEVDGQMLDLLFVSAGDYKYLMLTMGMNAPHSNYGCLFCHVKKDERYNTTVTHEERTLQSLHECAATGKFGVKHRPLINIEIEQIVIDELHLLLRISDVLINNLVKAVTAADCQTITRERTVHTDMLLQKIKECGITFRIWKSKETKENVWTSLRGNDRKKLLLKLPQAIPEIIPGENGPLIQKLWMDFNKIYAIINVMRPSTTQIDLCETMAHQWVKDFIQIKLDGHSKANVTPYMHIMCCHVPTQMRRFKGIKQFSGQGVEKNNDTARKSYQSSNHMDAPNTIIATEGRLNFLSSNKREKRKYIKRNLPYWNDEISSKRQKN